MMDPATMARLRYPFPSLMNPHAAAMQELTDQAWIDGEWRGFVPPDVAIRFKKVRTAYMTAYFFPAATWERLIPLSRMMLFSLYQDDIYENADPSLVRDLRHRTVAVARGETSAAEAGVMLGQQIETIRTEVLRFVPPETADRWATDLDGYFDGLESETRYLRSGEYPTVAEYTQIREKALMIHPFLSLKEVETQVLLPADIHENPIVRRLKSLAVRITGWFNEFQSYDKDMRTGTGNMNFINVLANAHGVDTAAARELMFQIHDTELAEFLDLQHDLPDFGKWTDPVANHIHHLSFVISGWRAVDAKISRYDPGTYIDQTRLKESVRIAP
jgi:hypothetical protein